MNKNIDLLIPLNISCDPNENLTILRVILTNEYTKIDFGYTADEVYYRGGWIRMSAESYIRVHGHERKYAMTHNENIPLAPNHLHFKSKKDWQYFSLFFEPIPKKTCFLDLIEEENYNENDFNYYGIRIDLDLAEKIIKP